MPDKQSDINSPQSYWIVLPAAGKGKRFGAALPKQYMPLAGTTVAEQTLTRILRWPRLSGIVVVVSADDMTWPTLAVSRHPKILTVTGGAERADSVLCGLRALAGRAAPSDWVLVHDMARPGIDAALLEHLVNTIAGHDVGGLLALPVSDTVKRCDEQGAVTATVPRVDLWLAQTPQMFRLADLTTAITQGLQQYPQSITDEASAIELAGQQPLLVEGAARNLKITRAEDLPLAEWYLTQEC